MCSLGGKGIVTFCLFGVRSKGTNNDKNIAVHKAADVRSTFVEITIVRKNILQTAVDDNARDCVISAGRLISKCKKINNTTDLGLLIETRLFTSIFQVRIM